MEACLSPEIPELEKVASGKVRELFAVDDEHLLFVASDRISAFDVVMANGIPDKGKILTQLTVFWLELLGVPNHLVGADPAALPAPVRARGEELAGRCMLVRKLQILPVEAIVRGYLSGSGWKEYRERGSVCGIPLPEGLQESAELPEPLFTPSTKAEYGQHDENIHPERAAEIVGDEVARRMADTALDVYHRARDYAAERGVIIADTKFEFGFTPEGELLLGDEVLTPDASRFWPADDYRPGRSQESFDKQYVRDYLESIGFDKTTPVELPAEVVANTRDKYIEAFRRITGREPEL